VFFIYDTNEQISTEFGIGVMTIARVLNETDTLRKTVRTLIWGSRRPLHGVANVTSSVANEEIGFIKF
jgi:hypothetical protein